MVSATNLLFISKTTGFCPIFTRILTVPDLYPKVFHKNKKERKSKGVDIQMTIDILTHVFQNNLDVVYLVSGDGDYKPIIEECIRYGKQVYIAAFSSGLNKSLKNIADVFIDLDPVYFNK